MDKIQELKNLRQQGLTIREISQRIGVPKSTVHKMLRNNMDEDTEDLEKDFRLIHLPYTYFCPNCGQEQNHAWLCLECGKFLPTECEDEKCYKGFEKMKNVIKDSSYPKLDVDSNS